MAPDDDDVEHILDMPGLSPANRRALAAYGASHPEPSPILTLLWDENPIRRGMSLEEVLETLLTRAQALRPTTPRLHDRATALERDWQKYVLGGGEHAHRLRLPEVEAVREKIFDEILVALAEARAESMNRRA